MLRILLLIPLVFSCSLQSIVIRQMEPILENSSSALYEETDYDLAKIAIPGNLKLIEGLIKSDPENDKLLLLAAEGYSGYAMGFLEDNEPERAKNLYLRARDYAVRVLHDKYDIDFLEMETTPFDSLVKIMTNEDVPALFWTGFSWAGYINLSLTEPSAIIALTKVQAMMQRIEQLQPEYFNAAVYLFFGSIYGMKPRILGGDPEKAKINFEKNLRITNNSFLLSYVYMAKFYAAKILDEELFDQYLNHVIQAEQNPDPQKRLMDAIAKQKAKHLLAMKEELF